MPTRFSLPDFLFTRRENPVQVRFLGFSNSKNPGFSLNWGVRNPSARRNAKVLSINSLSQILGHWMLVCNTSCFPQIRILLAPSDKSLFGLLVLLLRVNSLPPLSRTARIAAPAD